jgi:phosphodiesterase/alkaline phosphatase D-like protein
VFALASCQYPAGMLDDVPARASYRRLAKRLDDDSRPKPEFLLLLGDQIYADATAGLFDPAALFDRFERPHDVFLKLLTEVDVRSIPIYMMLDDHEIADNWEPPRTGGTDPLLVEGREHYLRQRRMFGPDLVAPVGDSRVPLWYPIASESFPFFVADTRTEREARSAATIEGARIMSPDQFEALRGWLSEQKENDPDRPKFVASPSIVLPRRLRAARDHVAAALRSDAWDGYPSSLHALLAHIAQEQIRNVVFLSGDEHLSCVAKIDVTAPGKRPVQIVSVHSSGLYAPFPFANSVQADLAGDDEFYFPPGDPLKHHCKVATQFAPGDGFAVIRVWRDGTQWKVDCEFDRAAGVMPLASVLP